jgi:HAE1 family hydrophobic/amphiphilic exporter-1
VYAFKNLQIQIEAVDLARRQVESNQRQVDQGILAPIDIVEAETQLSTFEQGLYTAQQALTRAEDVLKALMLRERTAPLWSAALVPVTPVNVEAPSVEFPEAIKEALGSRPELAQVQLSLDVNQANNRYFREQTKPQVDLVASYAGSGLAGQPVAAGPNPFTASTAALTDRINTLSQLQGLTPLPVISGGISGAPPFFIGGYGTSLSNLTSWNYPSANASLKISLPLRNRTAEANLAASIADGRRLEVQRRQIEQRVESDVRDTLQGVQSTRERLNAAVMARQSSEEQYQSEQRKFQEGTSTVFLVLQRQTAMITARNGELRAQTDLSKAIADFERSTTRTFAVRNIQIQGSKP